MRNKIYTAIIIDTLAKIEVGRFSFDSPKAQRLERAWALAPKVFNLDSKCFVKVVEA